MGSWMEGFQNKRGCEMLYKIKMALILSVAVYCASSFFYILYLREDVSNKAETISELKSVLEYNKGQYEKLKQSCDVSLEAALGDSSDALGTNTASQALKDRLKGGSSTGKTSPRTAETTWVIPTYTRGDLSGSKGLETPTNDIEGNTDEIGIDSKLPSGIISVLNEAYCSATNNVGGDSKCATDHAPN